jgi:hypothetical protein
MTAITITTEYEPDPARMVAALVKLLSYIPKTAAQTRRDPGVTTEAGMATEVQRGTATRQVST